MTVTAHIYEGRGQVDLDGVYLSDGGSSQYAAGCGETFAISAQNLATHYTFLQWVVQYGSVSNPTTGSTWYTPPNPSTYRTDTISLVLSVDTADASSTDWNYYNSYLETGWYAAGYQVGPPSIDQSGAYSALGYIKLPDAAHVAYAYGPCEDPGNGVCYDEVIFGVGLGYPPSSWSLAGIDMEVNYWTNEVTLEVLFHSPSQEWHEPFIGNLGDNASVSVAYQPSTGTNTYYVCDGGGCQTHTLAGTPDLSRVFYFATMNVYDPDNNINAPPAMWIQIPKITQPVIFGPVASVLNPSDRVVCDFNQALYTVSTITPGYTSSIVGASSFSLSFSYG